MNFPDWATPGELRMLYSEARTLGADDLTISDIDAVKEQKVEVIALIIVQPSFFSYYILCLFSSFFNNLDFF